MSRVRHADTKLELDAAEGTAMCEEALTSFERRRLVLPRLSPLPFSFALWSAGASELAVLGFSVVLVGQNYVIFDGNLSEAP